MTLPSTGLDDRTCGPAPLGRVVVLGSINADLFARVARHPAPGETVLGRGGEVRPGGKGANQAVAAALSGARVVMIGAVGDDEHATSALSGLRRSGCDVAAVRVVTGVSTGLALITVSDDGENAIIVLPGANAEVGAAELTHLGTLTPADLLVLQGEIPAATSVAAAERARAAGARLVLNLAPVLDLPAATLRAADPLVVNEHEGAAAAGIVGAAPGTDPTGLVSGLMAAGVPAVVLTLGARGALVGQAGRAPVVVPAEAVTAVDTTGAGDAFVGALAAALVAGRSLEEAARVATSYAAQSVTAPGAQDSYPGWGAATH